jgi:glycosyltransferase involved in cell wall biosynthesis
MSNRTDILYITDIRQSIEAISSYTENSSFEDFSSDRMKYSAVIREFEIIGEAVGKLSDSIRNEHAQKLARHQRPHCSSHLKTSYLGRVITIKDFYKEISLLLVPSTIPEGYPRVIIEAALNGIPTIANNTGGIPEALGNSGILLDIEPCAKSMAVQYEAAINTILNEYPAYKEPALARASEYSKDTQNKSLLYAGDFL